MKKIILCLFIFLLIPISAKANNLCSGAKSAILINSMDGEILYEYEKDLKCAPASMTKIMTLLLIYDSINEGNLKKDDMIGVSEYAKSMGGSQVFLDTREKLSVDDMLKCICIASANDAAVAMAEHIYGSEAMFVEKMNERAKGLGCCNTNFLDCTGLNDNEHYSSAYDMALISKELISKYPDVLNYTSIKEDYIRKDTDSPFWLVNTNKTLGHVEGILGLKTGYTNKAGYCITLVQKKDELTLISVVMGYADKTKRNAESIGLLNYGFSNYKNELVIKKNDIIAEISDIKYNPSNLKIIAKDNVYILRKKSDKEKYNIKYNYEVNDNNLNSSVGKAYIYDNNDNLIKEVDLYLSMSVKKNSLFNIIRTLIGRLLQ